MLLTVEDQLIHQTGAELSLYRYLMIMCLVFTFKVLLRNLT